MLWHIGNTTVRTPYRLRDALIALQKSSLNGNLSGKERENEFAILLHEKGVLEAPRVVRGSDASDLGRKWRAALMQLGFITPKLPANAPELTELTKNIKSLSGNSYEITPNGHRLANAKIITAQQECFLRSLAVYQIPSVIENRYSGSAFSPFRFVLKIIKCLSDKGHKEIISFREFALFIQTSTPEDELNKVVQNIIDFRNNRNKAMGKIRAFDRFHYNQVATAINRKESTIDDYTDLTFRYLKATGVFRNAGRGIALNPAKKPLALLLCEENYKDYSLNTYFQTIWKGTELPTDNFSNSFGVVRTLADQLKNKGVTTQIPSEEILFIDLENKRHELEQKVLQLEEETYANIQSEQLDEIFAWMEAIPSRGSAKLPNGDKVSIPKGEGPAYLEWIIWRAFLAINSLCNPPWESRRFQIDQDFLPVHCAPGGGPDMVFEFEDSIVVVEVTLTASSRQEAAEGEPVRRHVANYSENSSKDVYGLFIALTVDSNTAHTFRSGDWYLKDDSKLNLDIVPITLEDFKGFLSAGRNNLSNMPKQLRQILIECRAKANQDAPQWKTSISTIVNP